MKRLPQVDGVDPKEHDKYGITFSDPSLTKQEFKDDNTPDHIIDVYTRTGQLPNTLTTPQYGDMTNTPTFQEAMQIIAKGNEAFMKLNAETRKYFDNDPAKFIDFTNSADNVQEGVRLGLWTLPPDPEKEKPMKVEVVNKPETEKK
nr:MAG: internal scaffolding protein [Microviridae sp.]